MDLAARVKSGKFGHQVNSVSELSRPSEFTRLYPSSPRASSRFNQVTVAKRFEGVFLCRKVC